MPSEEIGQFYMIKATLLLDGGLVIFNQQQLLSVHALSQVQIN